jgi:hypothetical protein
MQSLQSPALRYFSFRTRFQKQAFDTAETKKAKQKLLGFSWSG